MSGWGRTQENDTFWLLWPWREFQQFPAHLEDTKRLENTICSLTVYLPLKRMHFPLAPGWVTLHVGASVKSLPTPGCHAGGGIPVVTPSILPFFMWSPLLFHWSCSISPQFFRSNSSMCRYRFVVSLGRGDFGSSYIPSWTFWVHTILILLSDFLKTFSKGFWRRKMVFFCHLEIRMVYFSQ